MKTNNYLFLSLCLCIPLFALTGCDNDSSEEPFGTDTERYDIPLDTKSLEVNARGQKFAFNFYKEMAGKEESNFLYLSFKRLLLFGYGIEWGEW